ncbi:MAG: hydrogenase expression/formation protein HypE [Eubacterium sp.]|nr:hydrogenase expression/formation protein HypE [Eubacterium sp.]
MEKQIAMIHGSGGAATGELIHEVFASAFKNEILDAMEDAAVLPTGAEGIDGTGRIAVTTDSFVVTPVEFRGGDIGRLAVCGTVNDLLMRGAVPRYLTSSWILEVGVEIETLRRVVTSMAETAKEAGITVVCGDTKVVEGQGGIYVNTTGIGVVPEGLDISAKNAKPGDVILVSGTMGDHHAAILSERISIDTDIASDVAPLVGMCEGLRGLRVHTLRDVTRGGLGTVLKELALASETTFVIEDSLIPVDPKVRNFCGLLGLDPVYMGNEGKLVCIVDPADEEEALRVMREAPYGEHAARIGVVEASETDASYQAGSLYVRTAIGGLRELDVLQGEGLPRIC